MAGATAGLTGLKSYLHEAILSLDKHLGCCQAKVAIFTLYTIYPLFRFFQIIYFKAQHLTPS
jgi:hypothetical protein